MRKVTVRINRTVEAKELERLVNQALILYGKNRHRATPTAICTDIINRELQRSACEHGIRVDRASSGRAQGPPLAITRSTPAEDLP
jgi:hypothetical protein